MPLMMVIIEINLLDWNRHEGRTKQPQTFVAMFHFSHNNGIVVLHTFNPNHFYD